MISILIRFLDSYDKALVKQLPSNCPFSNIKYDESEFLYFECQSCGSKASQKSAIFIKSSASPPQQNPIIN